MITGQDILFISLPSWDGEYMKSAVFVAKELSKNNRVLFIDYEFTYKDIVMTLTGKESAPVTRMLNIDKSLRKITGIDKNLIHVLTPPPVFPTNWINNNLLHDIILKINAKKILRRINWALKMLNMTPSIVINSFNPFFGLHLTGKFNEKILLYYCYDEISGAKWCKKHGVRLEKEFLKKADIVITTSRALYIDKVKINSNCHIVKNGVDFEVLSKWAFSKKSSSEKTVGFIGSLDERVNYKLLKYLAQNGKDLKFKFVGRIVSKEEAFKLNKFSNVDILGSKDYKDIPKYIEEMDVGIIPFISSKLTNGIYPLKINEYLALGKPVVMTTFANLPEFKGIVSVKEDYKEFLDAIKKEINSDSNVKKKIRIDIASSNSWNNRIEEISDIIFTYLEQK